jgi:hypothetical protein
MKALKSAAVAVWMATGAAAVTVPDSLTVVIFDYAGIPRRVLVSAAREGRRAFRAAGVETNWILCGPRQSCYVPERFVQVKILPRALKSTPVSTEGLASTTMCSTTEHCAASYVFYDRVLAFAGDVCSPADVTLGYVMAHEIGHLMGLGHRPGGIMEAGFTARDLHKAAAGWLSFAPEDARDLRAAVARPQRASEPARHIKLPASQGE